METIQNRVRRGKGDMTYGDEDLLREVAIGDRLVGLVVELSRDGGMADLRASGPWRCSEPDQPWVGSGSPLLGRTRRPHSADALAGAV